MSRRTATPDQDSRTARALRHGEGYTFTELNPGEFVCETPAGNSYLTSATFCTCPDSEFNLRGTDICCRHRVQLAHSLLELGVLPAVKKPTASEKLSRDLDRVVVWTEKDEAAFDRLFGG